MPNWCSNEITITGNEKALSLLRAELKKYNEQPDDDNVKGLFDFLIGRKDDMTDEQYKTDGHEHNREYYGCKWDVFKQNGSLTISGLEDDYDDIVMTLYTAWSPPSEFCKNLAEKYDVEVTIDYEEGGNDFCGRGVYSKDDCSSEQYSYMEGKYLLDMYWEDELDYHLENFFDENEPEEATFATFMKEHPYIHVQDLERVKGIFDNHPYNPVNHDITT